MDAKSNLSGSARGIVTDVIMSGNKVTVRGLVYSTSFFSRLSPRVTLRVKYVSEPSQITADVNMDGVVSIQDLQVIASRFGQSGEHAADVNRDGIVNIYDLVLVAGMIGSVIRGDAAAPSVNPQTLATLSVAEVQEWLEQARQLAPSDIISQRGIAVLEQLLLALPPKETALLSNYPNPSRGTCRGDPQYLCDGREIDTYLSIRSSVCGGL